MTINQIEFIFKMLSKAYIPVFKKHFGKNIALTNLFRYGIDALKYKPEEISGSKSRLKITEEFRSFVMENKKL